MAGLAFTVIANVSALVWGAAKMSSKVEQVNDKLGHIQNGFDSFLAEHKNLEKLVGTHSTAIALLAQVTKTKIRHTDIEEGFGHDRP